MSGGDFFKKIREAIGASDEAELRAYLAGKVAIIATSDKDVRDELYAITTPPYARRGSLLEGVRRWACVTRESNRKLQLVIFDIDSMDDALWIANAICAKFLDRMPFDLERVEVTITFRACEDAGLFHKYEVSAIFAKNDEKRRQLAEEVAKFVENLKEGGSVR